MIGHVYKFTAGTDDDGRRIDRIIRKLLKNIPLSAVYRLFRTGNIRINGKRCKQDFVIRREDIIEITNINDIALKYTYENKIYEIPSTLSYTQHAVYQNVDIAIINKPQGIDTHGNKSIAKQLLSEFPKSNSLSFVPAPLHRLDRNTSGLLIVSKTLIGAQKISAAIKEHLLEKHYLAVLEGALTQDFFWNDYLLRDQLNKITHVSQQQDDAASKLGVLKLAPLAKSDKFTLADVTLVTGLTHQIRAQCAFHGFPLAGDTKYGSKTRVLHYFLHAWAIKNLDSVFTESPHVITAFPDESQVSLLCQNFQLELPKKDDLVASLQ